MSYVYKKSSVKNNISPLPVKSKPTLQIQSKRGISTSAKPNRTKSAKSGISESIKRTATPSLQVITKSRADITIAAYPTRIQKNPQTSDCSLTSPGHVQLQFEVGKELEYLKKRVAIENATFNAVLKLKINNKLNSDLPFVIGGGPVPRSTDRTAGNSETIKVDVHIDDYDINVNVNSRLGGMADPRIDMTPPIPFYGSSGVSAGALKIQLRELSFQEFESLYEFTQKFAEEYPDYETTGAKYIKDMKSDGYKLNRGSNCVDFVVNALNACFGLDIWKGERPECITPELLLKKRDLIDELAVNGISAKVERYSAKRDCWEPYDPNKDSLLKKSVDNYAGANRKPELM